MRNLRLFAILPLMALSACSDDINLPSWMESEEEKPKLEGERVDVLQKEKALKPDETIDPSTIELPAAEPLTDWPQHHGNEMSSLPHIALAENIAVQESVDAGEGEDYSHGLVASPIVARGVVYTLDAAGKLSAHKADQISTILWQNNGVANAEEDPMLAGGLAYADGKIFAVSGDGLVAAFDAGSGRELWRQAIKIPVRAAPTLAAGRVFIVTIDSQLYTLDALTGSILWSDRGINEGASFLANASASYSSGLVVAPYASGELKIISADNGQTIWSDFLSTTQRGSATGIFSGIGGDPVIVGNALYAVSSSGLIAAYRLDNGLRVWEQAIASTQTPLALGNMIFVVSSSGELVALSRMDGRIFWVAKLPRFTDEEEKTGAIGWTGPVMAGSTLYVAGTNGELRRFSPLDGKEGAVIEIPEAIHTPPVVANGRMYLVSQDATLYSLY